MVQYPIVEIEWEDSSCGHGWQEDLGPTSCDAVTVGYLIKEDKGGYKLAESVMLTTGHAEYGCTTGIPKSAVRKMRILRKGRK